MSFEELGIGANGTASALKQGEPAKDDAKVQGAEGAPEKGNEATAAENITENKDYKEKMAAFDQREATDLMDKGISTEQYLEKLYKREKEELEYLKGLQSEFERNPDAMKDYSPDQLEDIKVRTKNLEYNQETVELREKYLASLKDENMSAEMKESIAAAYNERQADLTEFRKLIENSEQFKDNDHMARMRDMEKELEAAQTLEAQDTVKIKIAGEKRAFDQEVMNSPEMQEKFLSFVENNRDNKVIKESALGESVELYRERNQSLADARELEHGQVTPNGRPTAGTTHSNDERAAETAQAEVAALADDGRGGINPVRLEGGQNMSRGDAAPAQTTPGSDGKPQEIGLG